METCNRCEKPLSNKYWLHIFHNDGREEKIRCGRLTGNEGPCVTLFVDFKCSRGWKNKIRNRCEDGRNIGRHEVEYADKFYTSEDLKVVRRGDRILMVLPNRMFGVAKV